MSSIDVTLQTAQAYQLVGKSLEAEAVYLQVLHQQPTHAGALHALGLLKLQNSDPQTALTYFTQAIVHSPDVAVFYTHAGDAAFALTDYARAINFYKDALVRQPHSAEVLHNLGLALVKDGQLEAAIQSYQKALSIQQNFPSAYYNLGVALHDKGDMVEAIRNYRKALSLRPDHPSTRFNLAVALQQQGETDEAAQLFQSVVRLKPNHLGALYNLARLLQENGQITNAIEIFKNLLEMKPDHPGAYYWLGKALHDLWNLDEAVAWLKKGIQNCPHNAALFNLLAYVFNNLAQHENAIAVCQQAIVLKPDFWQAHSNLLGMMHYLPHDLNATFSAHQLWADRHVSQSWATTFTHPLERMPGHRLRVGYVSPNFKRGPVGYVMRSLLSAHHKDEIEIYCYYNFDVEDDLTQQLKNCTHVWRNIVGMDDEAVAKLIYQDKVDILVDLSGHTAEHRLLVFARKPAPIQVSWLDYYDTTGVPGMDYLISDAIHTPLDTKQRFTEEVIRLPHTRLCFSPPEFAPDVAPLPAIKNGFLTFGSFNRSSKMGPLVIALWSRILREIPDARLILKGGGHNNNIGRSRTHALFAQHGIAENRIELRSICDHGELLSEYGDIDIALDTFPHNGGATTFDALWMGVPVIALLGQDIISRQSAAMLSNVGLHQFIANSEDAYVGIAKSWQADFSGLVKIRANLRPVMSESPLCDGGAFARDMEEAYRSMWARVARENG